jgi:hypothetical protein
MWNEEGKRKFCSESLPLAETRSLNSLFILRERLTYPPLQFLKVSQWVGVHFRRLRHAGGVFRWETQLNSLNLCIFIHFVLQQSLKLSYKISYCIECNPSHPQPPPSPQNIISYFFYNCLHLILLENFCLYFIEKRFIISLVRKRWLLIDTAKAVRCVTWWALIVSRPPAWSSLFHFKDITYCYISKIHAAITFSFIFLRKTFWQF